MKDLIVIITIAVAWYVLNKYVLPRFGVKTCKVPVSNVNTGQVMKSALSLKCGGPIDIERDYVNWCVRVGKLD